MHNWTNPHIYFFHSARDFTNAKKSYTYFTKDVPQLDTEDLENIKYAHYCIFLNISQIDK